LLVRARPEPHEWVLPKGHIESGDTAAETAAREVKEEAGVAASVEQYVGDTSFVTSSGDPVSVAFFLMKYEHSEPSKEGREVRWCTFSEAAHMVPFENLRDLLTVAQAKL
jgi:8-oxo-dGTP pyrophosphatase MutT (NUDIX family)